MTGPGPGAYGRPPFAPPDVPRLFVAIPIPADLAVQVGNLVEGVSAALGAEGQRVRWVQMEGLHITLRFLGPTARNRIEMVAACVDRLRMTSSGPIEIRLGGAGAFPEPTRPRALWLGIRAGAIELGHLASALTVELVKDGWELEDRPFRPHLTIARTDGVHAGAEAGRLLIVAAAELDLGFIANRVVLYRSHLGHGPARYEALHTVPLE